MTDTIISSKTKDVIIGFEQPFVVIGERINPTGRKLLAEEMKNGDYSRVEADALAQVAVIGHFNIEDTASLRSTIARIKKVPAPLPDHCIVTRDRSKL